MYFPELHYEPPFINPHKKAPTLLKNIQKKLIIFNYFFNPFYFDSFCVINFIFSEILPSKSYFPPQINGYLSLPRRTATSCNDSHIISFALNL